jgi:RimJ/RimL family protein N-acetyltransferase
MNGVAAVRPAHLPVGLIHPLTLDDGRRLIARPLLPQDEAAEQAFVMALSATSRYRRFHVGLRELPPSALERLVRIDHREHVALVAHEEGDDDTPMLVADARYVRDGARSAEFAIAVADGWQGRGLARRLLGLLGRRAARHGLVALHGDVLADNTPMLRLLERLGATIEPRTDERGVLLATLRL